MPHGGPAPWLRGVDEIAHLMPGNWRPFAETGDYIDQAGARLLSGMQMRLAFSVRHSPSP